MTQIKKFTAESMEVYAELVRLLGEQASTIQDNTFYWSFILENCDDIGIEILFSTEDDHAVIDIYEVFIEDQYYRESISMDVIYTIVGYGCYKGIKIKNGKDL